MIKDIESIFGSITPDNIKDIPIIQDAMAVFIETIEDLAKESIQIKNIYENDKIREELSKIYLDDLYNVLKAVESNQKLIQTIDKINSWYNPDGLDQNDPNYISFIRRDAISNVSQYINDEHFLTFKSYKEKKGTLASIKYIYELLNIFANNGLETFDFEITEGAEPFHLDMRGTLPKEFYEYIIYPLAHPLGFTYTYERFMSLALEDYFPEMKITYDVSLMRVVCLQDDGSYKFDNYINNVGAQGNLTSFVDTNDLKVTSIRTFLRADSRVKEFYLSTGHYFVQTTNAVGQTYVVLYNADDSIAYDYSNFYTDPLNIRHCSIEIDYTYVVETTVTDDAYDTQYKTSDDWWGRLDDALSDPPTGSIHSFDMGYNSHFDEDGNYIIGGSQTEGRLEHKFAPSYEANLKFLIGQYKTNYAVKATPTGPTFWTQPVKYLDWNDSSADGIQVVERVNSLETFIKQNEGNQEFHAREHLFDNQYIGDEKNILIEPVYNSTEDFIDYNGVNRGRILEGLMYIGDKVGGTDEIKDIGDYSIGAYYNFADPYNNDFSDPNSNPNLSVATFETLVSGEPVNLQYNTWDWQTFEQTLSFGVDNVDIVGDEQPGSLTSTVSDTLYYEIYGYYNHDFDIGSLTFIIQNTSYVYGEPFNELTDYIRNQTTVAVIDGNINGFDNESLITNISGKETYSYYLYTNQASNDSLMGEPGLSMGGDIYSEEVEAEVYRGNWNFFDLPRIDLELGSYEELTADVSSVLVDDVNRAQNGRNYKTDEEWNGTFADDSNISSEQTINIAYEVFYLDELPGNIGDEVVRATYPIGDTGFYIYGSPHYTEEESLDKLSINTDENNLYEYNTFLKSGQIAGFDIGQEDFFVTGEIRSEIVNAEIYRADWNGDGTEDIYEDDFDFGVYRNGVRLEDNNISAAA